MQYTREAKLINYIMRIKISEVNPINNILAYIPHFEEVDQIGHIFISGPSLREAKKQ